MVEDASAVHGPRQGGIIDAFSCFGGGKSGEGGAGRVGGNPAEWMRVGACARWSGWQGSCSSEGWFGMGTGALGLLVVSKSTYVASRVCKLICQYLSKLWHSLRKG